MKRKLLSVVVLCIALIGVEVVLPAWAGSDAWTTSSLAGYTVNTVALDPTNPATVYVGTNYGLLVSPDGGTTWTGLPGSMGQVSAVVVHAGDSAVLFTAVNGELRRSEDGGHTWSTLGSGVLDNAWWMGAHTLRPDTIYVNTYYGGLFRSPDRGITWSGAGLPVVGRVQAVAFDPTNADVTYVALADGQGVFRTRDGGKSWSLISEGLGGYGAHVFRMAVDPAGTLIMQTQGGIYRSTDGGQSWQQLVGQQEYGYRDRYSQEIGLAVDLVQSDVIYLGWGKGILRSDDGGTSWIQFTDVLPSAPTTLMPDPRVAKVLYAIADGRLYKSQDAGDTWQGSRPGAGIQRIVAHPTEPGVIFGYSGGRGILSRSQDGAQSWSSSNAGLEEAQISVLTFDLADPGTVYAGTTAGLYRSIDGGRTWVLTGLPTNVQIYAVAVDPKNSDNLYVGGATGLLCSTNGGESWTAAPFEGNVSSVVVDPQTPQTVYAAAGGQLYRSDNGGESWRALAHPGQGEVYSIVLKPDEPTTLYISAQDGLYISRDSGAGWSKAQPPSNEGYPLIRTDTRQPEVVYLAWGTKIFVSPDAGSRWSSLNQGAPGLAVADLAVDAGDPLTLYATFQNGAGGVWRYRMTRMPEPATPTPTPSPSATLTPWPTPRAAVTTLTPSPPGWAATTTPTPLPLLQAVAATATSRASGTATVVPVPTAATSSTEESDRGAGWFPIAIGALALALVVGGGVLLWRRWLRGPALVSGPVACPNCGATNPPGSRFCVRCGHRLTEK